MVSLKDTPEGLMEAFEHQLVYEVNMLRQTYNFLCVPAWSPELANAIIEAFCVHARNLVDFFSEQSVTPGQARQGYMGAKHFCNDYVPWSEGRPDGELYGSLNEQISHLTYNRSSADNEKIGRKERLELLRQIERELEIFAARLKPIYKERWPFGKVQRPREGVNALPRYNVTSQVQTIGLRASLHDAYGYAGSGPSSLPPDAPEKSEKKGSE